MKIDLQKLIRIPITEFTSWIVKDFEKQGLIDLKEEQYDSRFHVDNMGRKFIEIVISPKSENANSKIIRPPSGAGLI